MANSWSLPRPAGECLLRHEHGSGYSGVATADRQENAGRVLAVTMPCRRNRVLTPLRRPRRGGTSPTPPTADLGPGDSQTDLCLDDGGQQRNGGNSFISVERC